MAAPAAPTTPAAPDATLASEHQARNARRNAVAAPAALTTPAAPDADATPASGLLKLVAYTDDRNSVIARIKGKDYVRLSSSALFATETQLRKHIYDSCGHWIPDDANVRGAVNAMMGKQDEVPQIQIVPTVGRYKSILVLERDQLDLSCNGVPIPWNKSKLLLWPTALQPAFNNLPVLALADLTPRNRFLRDVHRVYGEPALMLMCITLGHMASIWHCETRHSNERMPLLLVGQPQLAKSALLKCAADAVGCKANVGGPLDTAVVVQAKMSQLALVIEDLKNGQKFTLNDLKALIEQQYNVGRAQTARGIIELSAATLISFNEEEYDKFLSDDGVGDALRSRLVCVRWTAADMRGFHGTVASLSAADQQTVIASLAQLPFPERRTNAIRDALPATLQGPRPRQAVAVRLCYAETIMGAYLTSEWRHAPLKRRNTICEFAETNMSSWPEVRRA